MPRLSEFDRRVLDTITSTKHRVLVQEIVITLDLPISAHQIGRVLKSLKRIKAWATELERAMQ